MRDKLLKHGSVNGEVVYTLLGLLDQGVPIKLPGEVFDASINLFESLVNRHGADGNGRVSDDPFASGVDVFTGGKVHHGVGAPLGGPTHFLDLFVDS